MKSKIILSLFFFASSLVWSQKEIQRCNFAKAKKERKISFTAFVERIRDNGYFNLRVKNTTKDSLAVHVETGRVFYTADNGIQPFVVLRSKEIYLAPGEEKTTLLNTACGNATARGASCGAQELGDTEMGNPDLVAALEEVEALRLGNAPGIQQLVWAFTNNNSLASIVSWSNGKLQPTSLQAIAAKHKHMPLPKYMVNYETSAEGDLQAFSGRPSRVESELQIILEQTEDVQVVLRDDKGEIVKYIQLIHGQKAGQFSLPVELDMTGCSRGNYKLSAENSSGKCIKEMIIAI